MRYECVKAKSLLSKPIVADGWFHINRSMNAFQGCEHGCVYCDGMSEGYHVDNFLTHIRIIENAAKVLKRELKREGYTPQNELETETLWSFLDKEECLMHFDNIFQQLESPPIYIQIFNTSKLHYSFYQKSINYFNKNISHY